MACVALAFWATAFFPVAASELSGLARLDASASSVAARGEGSEITLALSQPVPWRSFTVSGPPRLVLDFRSVTMPEFPAIQPGLATGLDFGMSDDGWSRLVVDLSGPAEIGSASLSRKEDGGAILSVSLQPTDAESFAAMARQPASAPKAPEPPAQGRPVVLLDPGHGGIDPGAEAGGLNEKVLMLTFARELQEALVRGGLFDVALTREEDEFVPLETRISRARAAGADVFISLHADELPEGAGAASGITVYTLAAEASDEASRRLAERHDKADLLAGVTVSEPGDEISLVLLDLARRETAPRSEALASSLVASFRNEDLELVGRPLRSAAFSVLKAADFPSVLLELGFLSSEKDRERLTDPEWRARAVASIETALIDWSLGDAARMGLLRR